MLCFFYVHLLIKFKGKEQFNVNYYLKYFILASTDQNILNSLFLFQTKLNSVGSALDNFNS